MNDSTKLQATHLQRTAIVYVRQSSTAQVEHNRESTQRQYALVERALALGWQRDQISVIDDGALGGMDSKKMKRWCLTARSIGRSSGSFTYNQ